MINFKQSIKQICRFVVPLCLRKKIAVWLSHQSWISKDKRNWWSSEIIRDLAQKDINEYHKFLWTNHLAYAETYEPETRFGAEHVKESRKIFIRNLQEAILHHNLLPFSQIQSIFEVGCSLGYLLRFIETDVFPSAKVLIGNDIDKYAIEAGTEYLRQHRSKVQLFCMDMENLEGGLKGQYFDIIFSSGVLMYLQEEKAADVVQTMINHTKVMVAIAGLAHPQQDNSLLAHSVTRERDGSFIHNIDAMIERAGGKIISRRWEGDMDVDGNTVYFLFATPPSIQNVASALK